MYGNDCWNRVCFSCCWKADNELADVTLSGSLFQNRAAATGNARPPTVTKTRGKMTKLTIWSWTITGFCLLTSSTPGTYLSPFIVVTEITLHFSNNASMLRIHVDCVSKIFPPLNSLTLCQILTDFHKFCTAGKRTKFAIKHVQHYPQHLRHVATLPWEIKNLNFMQIFSWYGRKCKHIAF